MCKRFILLNILHSKDSNPSFRKSSRYLADPSPRSATSAEQLLLIVIIDIDCKSDKTGLLSTKWEYRKKSKYRHFIKGQKCRRHEKSNAYATKTTSICLQRLVFNYILWPPDGVDVHFTYCIPQISRQLLIGWRLDGANVALAIKRISRRRLSSSRLCSYLLLFIYLYYASCSHEVY